MHYLTLVVTIPGGATVEELLAPYSEELEVPEYESFLHDRDVAFMATHNIPRLAEFQSGVLNAEPVRWAHVIGQLTEDDYAVLAGKLEGWDGHPGGVREGKLFERRTDNPRGRWDWYSVGGRWDGYLVSGYDNGISKNAPAPEESHNAVERNTAPLDEAWPVILANLPAKFVPPTGEWHEKERWDDRLGTFVQDDDWPATVQRELGPWLERGALVMVVDCHN